MAFSHITANNMDDAIRLAGDLCVRELAQGKSPVVVTPARSLAQRVSRTWAAAEHPARFGVQTDALEDWLADRWELAGNDMKPIDQVARALLLAQTVGSMSGFPMTDGMLPVLDRIASGLSDRLADASDEELAAAGFVTQELAMAHVMQNYDSMASWGFVEPIRIPALLPPAVFSNVYLVFLGFNDLPPVAQRTADAVAAVGEAVQLSLSFGAASRDDRAPELNELLARLAGLWGASEDDGARGTAVEPSGSVQFLLPAGNYAAAKLLKDVLLEHADADAAEALPVAVASKDPLTLFDQLSKPLAQAGISGAVRASRPFAATAFGQAFIGAFRTAADLEWTLSCASDFAQSALSGISLEEAQLLDAKWRGNRQTDRDTVVQDLSGKSPFAAQVLHALEQCEWSAAAGLLSQRFAADDAAGAKGYLPAAVIAHDVLALAEELNVSQSAVLRVLKYVSVPVGLAQPVSSQSSEKIAPQVQFCSLGAVSALDPASCSGVVLMDLGVDEYPVKPQQDAGTLLAEKLQVAVEENQLMRARQRLFQAVEAARDYLVVSRPLHDAEAAEAYPAVMFEELTSCYRQDVFGDQDMDRGLKIPAALVPFARTAAEGALTSNLLASDDVVFRAVPVGDSHQVGQDLRTVMAPGAAPGALRLSASALETYLSCPYHWFASRRLQSEQPDEEFSPKERGTFVHAVMRRFYEELQKSGQPRVSSANLEAAEELLDEVFDQMLDEQETMKPGSRYLPLSTTEKTQVEETRNRIHALVRKDAAFLPGFAPTYFEYEFGINGIEPVPYAGAYLSGSIDRIDVNDRGQAVIVDYKGSASASYNVAKCHEIAWADGPDGPVAVPHCIQTLVYASVAQRLLGLDVVGAVYVSYKDEQAVAGAYDATVLGPGDLPGVKPKQSAVPSQSDASPSMASGDFKALLQDTEAALSRAVVRMAEGFVAAEPANADACKYCPVAVCEGRR